MVRHFKNVEVNGGRENAENAEISSFFLAPTSRPIASSTTLASTTSGNMGRSQGSSRQRVPRPDLKKRRPPVACIPCYRRKVKCGREVPVCRRCVQSGHERECHYRNSSPVNLPQSSLPQPGDAVPVALPRHVERPQPDGRDQSAQAFAQETSGPPQTISSRGMIHFKGRATSTRFYGFSYHLNLYQRV